MKTYKCPDCGKTWENEAPQTCTECGCPSHKFEMHESTPEKVYYQSDSIRITDKLWSFDATMNSNASMIGGLHFPVKSISSVGYFNYFKPGVMLLIAGLISILIGIGYSAIDEISELGISGLGVVFFIAGFLFIVGACVLLTRRVLVVHAHNLTSNFRINYISESEGNKLLNAMLQCLKENT